MNQTPATTLSIAEQHQPIGWSTAVWALGLSALWGGTPVAIKYSVATLEPFAVAGLRFAMAAAFMFLWCRLEGTPLRLQAGQFRAAAILGVLLFLQIGGFTVGIHWSNASHGTLLINTFVFWVAGLEHFLTRGARLSLRGWLGLLVASSGVVLVLSMTESDSPGSAASDAPDLAGDVMLFASAGLLGVKLIYTKRAVAAIAPAALIFWHDVVGVVLFAAVSLLFEDTSASGFTTPAVLGLLYQGVVVAGFCFAMQARLLRRHSAARLSVFSFATPLFGVMLAVLFRGDVLSPWLGAAAACVAVGIVLVNARNGLPILKSVRDS